MVLNVVTPERRLAHSPAGDMALVAGLFVVALTYLDVPFRNALLFGPAITLQAAVGVVVLTRLLKGVPGSLLLLLGPGLILGGALSFAIFQLVGRGTLGLVVVVAVGIGAVTILVSSATWQPLSASRMWTLGQILGLAALALTWEFPELLPVAGAFFVLGFFTGELPKVPRWLAWIVGALGLVAIALVPILRQDYWWLITDDYKFFEVVSLHLTRSGPLADWGAANFGQYHWLSYGWTGLLNELGGLPETLTTLTRVAPFVYSISFVSSLILVIWVAKSKLALSSLLILPTWAIVAFNRLDWSGTSTAGVFAVMSALTAMSLICFVSSQRIANRALVYLIFVIVAVLTKLPSIFTALTLISGFEFFARLSGTLARKISAGLAWTCLASMGVFPLVWAASKFVTGIAMAAPNPNLGQRASYGTLIALILILTERIWIATPFLIATLAPKSPHRDLGVCTIHTSAVLTTLVPLMITGVIFDVVMVGNVNLHEYFSGPAYLVASIALLVPLELNDFADGNVARRKVPPLLVAVMAIGGYTWSALDLATKSTALLTHRTLALLEYVAGNAQFGASLTALVIAVLARLRRRHRFSAHSSVSSLIFSLVLLSLFTYSQDAISAFGDSRTKVEIATSYGSNDERDVGLWLRKNSPRMDLLATHNLRDTETGGLSENFALAAWSQHEFLVLGPRFLGDIQDLEKWIQLCELFAEQPSRTIAVDLRQAGVSWFIIDSTRSKFTEWEDAWDVRYRNNQFIVLRL